jgi:Putative zinc-finger
MRCSLLALSSYIDTELDLEPAGELEAHLVACDRCRTAIGHLREESERIGALARVHVPDDAVHDLFSQIGLIAEEDDLPEGPVRRDRPAAVEAPPWFGVERGAALPWAPRPSGHDQSQQRELIGERSPTLAVAEPPEMYLWDETIDQIATTVPEPPAVHAVAAPGPAPVAEAEPTPVAQLKPETGFIEPDPPQIIPTEPQPPDLSTSAPIVAAPLLAAGPNAFQRLRDAVAVRLALRRGAGSKFDPGVEIVSGTGAPTWDQRARRHRRSQNPPVVATAAPPAVEPVSPAPVARPNRLSRFMARVAAEPRVREPAFDAQPAVAGDPETHDADLPVERTAPLQLAEVLSEVASLAAPLERTTSPVADGPAPTPTSSAGVPTATPSFEHVTNDAVPAIAPHIDTRDRDDVVDFGVTAEPAAAPVPGRHVRRLHSQKADRREWNPTRPVTGRHVLPLGGPAVGAADRDRRLWLFGAVTVVLMLLGLLIGRQVTPTGPLVASTIPRSTPGVRATTPATTAPLPIATPVPAPTALIPTAPTPQQLTKATTLGNGSGGFSVADVRYGLHPNDFRLVFDLAFPNTVTGSPTTVIGYYGPTTMYVEFTGVDGASNVAVMPPGKLVVSVVPLPMARNTDRLVFKITLSKNAPFDAYYLSGGRLVIDVT